MHRGTANTCADGDTSGQSAVTALARRPPAAPAAPLPARGTYHEVARGADGAEELDGVRADAIMSRLLVPPGGQTEEDKAFYKLALKTQEENPLPDHCTKEAYLLKAYAYLNYIRPNLPYTIEALDAS